MQRDLCGKSLDGDTTNGVMMTALQQVVAAYSADIPVDTAESIAGAVAAAEAEAVAEEEARRQRQQERRRRRKRRRRGLKRFQSIRGRLK